MPENVDFKLVLAVAATLISVGAYVPYFKDLFSRKTKPHPYTWLIWAITQGTAAAALLHGGGNFGALSLSVGVVLVVIVFLFSLKYGARNIARSDTIVLALALSAIFVWWRLDNPLVAVLMVSAIDGLGYIPTFRKSFADPWSETLSFWGLVALVTILSLISNAEYNLLTVTYLATLSVANTSLFFFLFFRRKILRQTQTRQTAS